MKRLLVLPLLLLVACATEDAQPDRPTAWNLSGVLVETVGDGCVWSGGDSIDLDLVGLGGNGGTSPDDVRIGCDASEDYGVEWRIGCWIQQGNEQPRTCDSQEFPQECVVGEFEILISKSSGAGTLAWDYDGCMFRFDVVATDL